MARAPHFGTLAMTLLLASATRAEDPAVVLSEFIYNEAPFASCHASTIAEGPRGLAAAWFGGTREGANDVGIWLSLRSETGWSSPIEVADGRDSEDVRYPSWNPVLFQVPGKELLLYYKVGPSPSRWWGMVKSSGDGGRTWSEGRRLPDDILGPIKNKPVLLDGGVLLCPSSTEHDGWRVRMEWTNDFGRTWEKSEPIGDGRQVGIIQPAILTHADGRLQFLCRSRQGRIYQAFSKDKGKTWDEPTPSVLPNPNSGIDALTLKDGRFLLIYNHTSKDRSPLNLALSSDGIEWKAGPMLEDQPGEYSYPAIIQTNDGLVHMTYTYLRKKIKHVVVDPAKIVAKDL